MLTVAITALTPMMMPSIVSAERSLFRARARSASRSVFMKSMASSFMVQASRQELFRRHQPGRYPMPEGLGALRALSGGLQPRDPDARGRREIRELVLHIEQYRAHG